MFEILIIENSFSYYIYLLSFVHINVHLTYVNTKTFQTDYFLVSIDSVYIRLRFIFVVETWKWI